VLEVCFLVVPSALCCPPSAVCHLTWTSVSYSNPGRKKRNSKWKRRSGMKMKQPQVDWCLQASVYWEESRHR